MRVTTNLQPGITSTLNETASLIRTVFAHIHHDDLVIDPQNEVNLRPRQEEFANTLEVIMPVLRNAGISSDQIFVHAGGGVFLYQHHYLGDSNRAPTDLDIIIPQFKKYRERVETELKKDRNNFGDFHYLPHERVHHGLTFPNPVFEVASVHQPIDIIGADLITKFPATNRFLPNGTSVCPIEDPEFYNTSVPITFNGHKLRVAPPAMIATYKLTYDRNNNGKQDTDDLIRLGHLGVYRDIKHMKLVLDLHFKDNPKIIPVIFRELLKLDLN